MYNCEYCNKTFTTKGNLRTHCDTAKFCLKLRGVKVNIKCEFCSEQFSNKRSKARHQLKCFAKAVKMAEQMYTDKLNQLGNRLETKVEIMRGMEKELLILRKTVSDLRKEKINADDKLRECELANLREKVEIYEDFVNRPQSSTPVIINNTSNSSDNSGSTNNVAYINPKLAAINIETIEPLTEETIRKHIENGGYTELMHNSLPLCGIVEFMASAIRITHPNGDIEMNYACTDISRNACHCLTDSRVWRVDHGAQMTETVLKCLAPSVKEYHLIMRQKCIDKLAAGGEIEDYDMKEMDYVFDAVVGGDRKGRQEIRDAVRVRIKEIAAV